MYSKQLDQYGEAEQFSTPTKQNMQSTDKLVNGLGKINFFFIIIPSLGSFQTHTFGIPFPLLDKLLVKLRFLHKSTSGKDSSDPINLFTCPTIL